MMIKIKSQTKEVCTSNQLSLINVNNIIIEIIISVIINVNVTDIHWSLSETVRQGIKLTRTLIE